MSERIVVYGLLRRGHSMAPLLRSSTFEGRVVLGGFEMIDLGSYPGVVPGEGCVVGEVYALGGDRLLAVLDRAEGVHEDPPLYRRIEVEALGAPAWLYVFARDVTGLRRIGSGDWADR
ncbi:MAG: gamma-glutamylcyclotransferase family protein [Planctomycetota bacterium]|jgi:gamma-glutamylcyclotransferase (GGCT)/AIG2-like uncharacterized protein YtfP